MAGDVGVPRADQVLNLDRAANRVHYAHELSQETVADQLDDSSPVFPDCGGNDLRTAGLQARQRALIILTHEATKADDVGDEDRSQAALRCFAGFEADLIWSDDRYKGSGCIAS